MPPPNSSAGAGEVSDIFNAGLGFEGILESISEEAGKLVDSAPLELFNLDQMAEDEEQARIAGEWAEDDEEEAEVQEVVHHPGALEEPVLRAEENDESQSEWDWSTPKKESKDHVEVTIVNYDNDVNEKKGNKGKRKKKNTKNEKKELDFFGFGGGSSEDVMDQQTEYVGGEKGSSGATVTVGDLEAGAGSFPVATPQFDSSRRRFEDEEDGGGNNATVGVGEALGITDSITSLLPKRLMAGLVADTEKISSFFDAGEEEDEDKATDPLLEQVERNRMGAGSPIGDSDVERAAGRSPGEVMRSIKSFDTRAAFRKYQAATDDLRRLGQRDTDRDGDGDGDRASGQRAGGAEGHGQQAKALFSEGAVASGPAAREGAGARGTTATGTAWMAASVLLRALWWVLASLLNLLLRVMGFKFSLPTALGAAESSGAGGFNRLTMKEIFTPLSPPQTVCGKLVHEET